jgi:hypothetical protein
MGTTLEQSAAERSEDALSEPLLGHYVHLPLADSCLEFEHLTLRADGSYAAQHSERGREHGQFEASEESLTLTSDAGTRSYALALADGAIQLTRGACAQVLALSEEPECASNDECAEGLTCEQGACVAQPIARPVEASDPTPCAERTGGAVVTFDVHGESLRVWSTNLAFIAKARSLIGASGFQVTPIFDIMRVGHDDCAGRAWSVNPDAMMFDDLTTEVCDAMPSYIDADVAGWARSPGQYCPWGPRVVAVEAVR